MFSVLAQQGYKINARSQLIHVDAVDLFVYVLLQKRFSYRIRYGKLLKVIGVIYR